VIRRESGQLLPHGGPGTEVVFAEGALMHADGRKPRPGVADDLGVGESHRRILRRRYGGGLVQVALGLALDLPKTGELLGALTDHGRRHGP